MANASITGEPSFNGVIELVDDITSTLFSVELAIADLAEYVESYHEYREVAAECLADHMPGVTAEAIQARREVLLKQLDDKNAYNLDGMKRQTDHLTDRKRALHAVLALHLEAAEKSLSATGAWYEWWHDQLDLDTPRLFLEPLYRIYFYQEMSPVDIDTIGFLALPYNEETKSGVLLGESSLQIFDNGKQHGRGQELITRPYEWKDIWYDQGVRQKVYYRRRMELNGKRPIVEFWSTYYPNNKLHHTLMMAGAFIMLIQDYNEDHQVDGWFYTQLKTSLKSGVYENGELKQTLEQVMSEEA